MGQEIFRQKSVDKMESPESLNDYIRVANPGVWLLLVCVILLLAGACVWGFFGKIDSTVAVDIRVSDHEITCYADSSDVSAIRPGLTVRCDEFEGVISSVGERGEQGYLCVVESDSSPADGVYAGKIVTKSYQPISFILN